MNTNLPPILDFGSTSNPNNGTLFDTRDGQSYPVVKIGNQIWLAENFRYLPSIKDKGDLYEEFWTPNGYLEKGYGRFYDWNTANNIAPDGWRLPSSEDFKELRDFVKEDNNLARDNDSKVGSCLKSIDGWYKPTHEIEPNNDKYGFNAKSTGFYNVYNTTFNNSPCTFFLSSTEESSNSCKNWGFDYDSDGFYSNYYGKQFGYSVRLIKTIRQ